MTLYQNTNHLEEQEIVNELLTTITRNAEIINLYSNLANAAPNQEHQSVLLDAMRCKDTYSRPFIDLFIQTTGQQPACQVKQIAFTNYQDGLERVFQAEFDHSEEYRSNFFGTLNPIMQNAFLYAFAGQRDNALRLNYLRWDAARRLQDKGSTPFVVNIEEAAIENDTFRTALWTGDHLQVTLMSIDVGDDIGLEVHPTTDQFIRIEEGQGLVEMGDTQNNLSFRQNAYADYAVMIPAGMWHNITNTGDIPMKVYAIYTPPEHPFGTVHEMKADAIAAEG
ncbi:cupin domain-containing protein [Bacillus sp. P14.5]|uniref:cupin domain-containing protein n=1 Tax=Bacillus sp. P14.5 TaxID=1983400 RepID=UPI000DE9DD68|nr:cupin domain-containing protein [Bacillus sp. P14.5]